MGLTGLESLGEFIAINRRNYRHYTEGLSGLRGLKLVTYDETEKNNYQYIVCEIDEDLTGISRDQVVRILHAENVIARRYFYPGCHMMEPYRSYFPHSGLLLPNTERLVKRVISLPTGAAVGSEEIREVCQIIRLVMEYPRQIMGRLDRQ